MGYCLTFIHELVGYPYLVYKKSMSVPIFIMILLTTFKIIS